MLQLSVEGIVDQPVDVVWKLITNPKKFHALRIPFVYENYATGEPRAGSVFEARSLGGGPNWHMYVVDCHPNREFSFGSTETDWTFHYLLKEQNRKTFVRFTRKFRSTFFGRVFGSEKKDCRKLADDTLDSLRNACKRLADGESDGLTES